MGNRYCDSVFSTVEPLNGVLKFFGLSSVHRFEGKLQYSWSCWKTTLVHFSLFCANVCNIYFKFQYIIKSPLVIDFNNFNQMFFVLEYFRISIDVIFVTMNRNKYLDYYSLYVYIDKVLGISNYVKIRKCIIKMCSLFIFIGAVSIMLDYVAWVIGCGFIDTTIYSIDYFYVGLRMICALDVITHYNQVLFRLKMIKRCLKTFFADNFKLRSLVAAQDLNRLNSLKIVCNSYCDVIIWLRRCYLFLLEQCDFINNVYGFRILVFYFIFLMDMVMLLNVIIRQIMGTLVMQCDAGILTIVSTLMRIVASLCLLLCGVSCCEQNYTETDRIICVIDDLLINKKIGYEERESLKELKQLIVTRPVKFKAMNFFRLDYFSFVSLASAIVTYTIIMLQSMN